MSTHWKKLTNPLYIGAYEFEPGQEITGTIARVAEEMVMGPDGKKEECIVAHFAEKNLKPLILNVTNCKMISKLYKTPYIEDWAGKRITMRVQQVKAFGDVVDAVRIKPEIPKAAPKQTAQPAPQQSDSICAECGQVLKAFGQMSAEQLAAYTKKKYGKCLCADCAKGAADKQTEQVAADKQTEQDTPENAVPAQEA